MINLSKKLFSLPVLVFRTGMVATLFMNLLFLLTSRSVTKWCRNLWKKESLSTTATEVSGFEIKVNHFKCKQCSVIGGDGRLDPSLKGSGFETTFRPASKGEERITQLSVFPRKRQKES